MNAPPGINFLIVLLVGGVKSQISIDIADKTNKLNKILKWIHFTIKFYCFSGKIVLLYSLGYQKLHTSSRLLMLHILDP